VTCRPRSGRGATIDTQFRAADDAPFAIGRPATLPADAAAFSSPVTRMLLSSDGLTTTLLESCTGQRVHVRSAEHDRVGADTAPSGAAELLRAPAGAELVVRRSVLAVEDGRAVSANQVVARSDLPSPGACFGRGAAPIGPALHSAGTGFRRSVLDVGVREWTMPPGGPAAFKTYLIWDGEVPSMLISELFNPAVIPAERTAEGSAR